MKLNVELQIYLKEYSPNGAAKFDYELADGSSVMTLVDALGVPDELANIVIVEGESTDHAHKLKDGDHVILIPPLAGG
ncbi:MAG: MoaD/ThiS family protein [Chloroflexi bacterium]|nr:MoaD/ThiS family protein [Chloroflexota bacterium]